MAGTLKQDPALERFNTMKQKQGHYFRFTTRSTLFNLLFMGIIPLGGAYYAYSTEGKFNFYRKFRSEKVLHGEDYTPRAKDL